MSFVSYAQNFEDVMLWRALKHVDQGFYVDVGANDPDIDSVTKAFYERGWRGINIEPVPQWFERLQEARPRDINLQLAAGREPGEIILFEIPDTGLSTAERAFVDRHKSERGYQSGEIKVHVETLTNLCERYHTAPIHFLKIDVEGMEKAVLEGLDFQKIRPWIILVESTLPNSQEECHVDWEPLLLDAGYQYAYFDGLNRFYVANEHSELLDAFKAPPNVFDDFLLSRQHEADSRAAQAEAREAEARVQAQQAFEVAQQAQELARQAEARAAQAAEAINTLSQQLETQHQQLHEAAEKAETLQQQLNEATARAAAEQARVEQLMAQLSEKEQALGAKQSELEQLHAHSQWLQNEWDAAKAKIEELNHTSHHWWTVADGLNRELQSVYRSKSWRITWPLRKLMQLLKWLFRLPVRLVTGLLRLPRRTARWLLAKAIAFVLRREGLKQRASRWLYRHPNLEAHLRAFARARGLIHSPIPVSPHPAGFSPASGVLNGNGDEFKGRIDHTSPAALTVDEILSNIRMELADAKINGTSRK